MKKFKSQENIGILKNLPFSYFSLPIYLDFGAYIINRNDEEIIVMSDICYPHEFPALFLPKNPLNWNNFSIIFATNEDREKIANEEIKIILDKTSATEYFYLTETLINPRGKINQRISQFNKLYQYKITNVYSRDKVKQFYLFWKTQKERLTETFQEAEEFFFFCLDNIEKYNIKQVYVEVDNQLVGFAWGIVHPEGNWVGLHLKVNYQYKGLSRFLHQERAKIFSDKKLFTLGTAANEPGIEVFKNELGPILKKDYFYILTGNKN